MKKVLILSLCSLAFSINSFALTKLTVDEAVDFALKNNVSIERTEITLNGLKRSDNHSWNSVSPTISFGASSNIPVDALSDKASDYTASFGINASISVSLTANLYTAMKTAKYNYEIGEISFEKAMRDVEYSVREAFYGLLYSKDNISLQEKNLEVARSQYQKNLSKYNQGRLSEIDVLSAEVAYKEKIPTVENAKTTYQNNLDNFRLLIGIDLNEEIELSGTLEDKINLNEISIDSANYSSSTIRTLEKRIEAAKNNILDERFSAYAPSLSAKVNFQDQSWYIGKESNANKSTSVSLSATIPLDGALPWSKKADKIESAKDSLKDYELQLDYEKNSFKISVDSSLRSIKSSQLSIKSKQANVKLAQRSYNMTFEAYNSGTKDLLSLQNANNSLLSAQLSLKNETYTLIKSILNLENKIGVPFGSL